MSLAVCSDLDVVLETRVAGKIQIQNHHAYGRSEFNKHRFIIVRNIPHTTYNEVKAFLGPFAVSDIVISRRQRHAIVELKNGSEAESTVRYLRTQKLLNVTVDVDLYRNDNLLCVTHLPHTFGDAELKSIVLPHGQIEKCFILRDVTGKSKGYGFVQYAHNRQQSELARRALDGRHVVDGDGLLTSLRCQYVKNSLVTFESLHSSVIYIDQLPADYNDCEELRNLFSLIAPPICCRVACHNLLTLSITLIGNYFLTRTSAFNPRCFAVVEFSSSIIAEQTFLLRQRLIVREHVIRIMFCTPGLSAIEVYNNIISEEVYRKNLAFDATEEVFAMADATGSVRKRITITSLVSFGTLVVFINDFRLSAKSRKDAAAAVSFNTFLPAGGFITQNSGIKSHSSSSLSASMLSAVSPHVIRLLRQNPTVLKSFQLMLDQISKQSTPAAAAMQASGHASEQLLLCQNFQISLLAAMLASQLQQSLTSSKCLQSSAKASFTNPPISLVSDSNNGQSSRCSDQTLSFSQPVNNQLQSSSMAAIERIDVGSSGLYNPCMVQNDKNVPAEQLSISASHKQAASLAYNNYILFHSNRPTPATSRNSFDVLQQIHNQSAIADKSQFGKVEEREETREVTSLNLNQILELFKQGPQSQRSIIRQNSYSCGSQIIQPTDVFCQLLSSESATGPVHRVSALEPGSDGLTDSAVPAQPQQLDHAAMVRAIETQIRSSIDFMIRAENDHCSVNNPDFINKDAVTTVDNNNCGVTIQSQSSEASTTTASRNHCIIDMSDVTSPEPSYGRQHATYNDGENLDVKINPREDKVESCDTRVAENVASFRRGVGPSSRPFVSSRRGRTTSTVRDVTSVIRSLDHPVVTSTLVRATQPVKKIEYISGSSSMAAFCQVGKNEQLQTAPAAVTPGVVGGGRKRQHPPLPRLLPSPEQSPDGGYIGQHSQGLGGHYADSYIKKCKLEY